MIPDKLVSQRGKYSNNVEAALHEMTDDADGFGSVETDNRYALVVLDESERAALAKLGDEWSNFVAFIVREDSQGFVHFHYYDTEHDARREYESAEAEWVEEEEEAEREAERDRFVPGRDAFKAGE
jgi:hypothetical protein